MLCEYMCRVHVSSSPFKTVTFRFLSSDKSGSWKNDRCLSRGGKSLARSSDFSSLHFPSFPFCPQKRQREDVSSPQEIYYDLQLDSSSQSDSSSLHFPSVYRNGSEKMWAVPRRFTVKVCQEIAKEVQRSSKKEETHRNSTKSGAGRLASSCIVFIVLHVMISFSFGSEYSTHAWYIGSGASWRHCPVSPVIKSVIKSSESLNVIFWIVECCRIM